MVAGGRAAPRPRDLSAGHPQHPTLVSPGLMLPPTRRPHSSTGETHPGAAGEPSLHPTTLPVPALPQLSLLSAGPTLRTFWTECPGRHCRAFGAGGCYQLTLLSRAMGSPTPRHQALLCASHRAEGIVGPHSIGPCLQGNRAEGPDASGPPLRQEQSAEGRWWHPVCSLGEPLGRGGGLQGCRVDSIQVDSWGRLGTTRPSSSSETQAVGPEGAREGQAEAAEAQGQVPQGGTACGHSDLVLESLARGRTSMLGCGFCGTVGQNPWSRDPGPRSLTPCLPPTGHEHAA